MIYIIAGSYVHAKKWAAAQMLSDEEWFCTLDSDDLKSRQNFHVVVLETASELPPIHFEKLFNLGQSRGRINRQ